MNEKIKVLDHGYLKLIEVWGVGEAGEMEAAIIEAARQSTQGSFRGWNVWVCNSCGLESTVKLAGHNDYRGENCKGRMSSDESLLKFMFENKHSTPFEFCGMTIEVQAPIAVFREWHRHRTQSYNEMSARYAPLPDLNYMPTVERLFLTQKDNKQAQAIEGAMELTELNADKWLSELDSLYKKAERVYQTGLDVGVPKEIARMCLPVGRYSRMRATGNLRNWLGFLSLRYHPKAQWEIREFAKTLGEEIIAQVFPKTWKLFNNSREK